MNLFQELKRRKVFKAVGVYAARYARVPDIKRKDINEIMTEF